MPMIKESPSLTLLMRMDRPFTNEVLVGKVEEGSQRNLSLILKSSSILKNVFLFFSCVIHFPELASGFIDCVNITSTHSNQNTEEFTLDFVFGVLEV